jgi:hypothetical protein
MSPVWHRKSVTVPVYPHVVGAAARLFAHLVHSLAWLGPSSPQGVGLPRGDPKCFFVVATGSPMLSSCWGFGALGDAAAAEAVAKVGSFSATWHLQEHARREVNPHRFDAVRAAEPSTHAVRLDTLLLGVGSRVASFIRARAATRVRNAGRFGDCLDAFEDCLPGHPCECVTVDPPKGQRYKPGESPQRAPASQVARDSRTKTPQKYQRNVAPAHVPNTQMRNVG